MRLKLFLFLLIIVYAGCAHKSEIVQKNATFTETKSPENIYLVDYVNVKVDSVYFFYQHALKTLAISDTIGAKIYFEKAFDIISDFDEDTKSVLMEWSSYDSLIHAINTDYERIFPQEDDQEAEEVREELTDLEENTFGDLDVIDKSIEIDTTLATIPLEINSRVELAMKYFQTKGRKVFSTWLERAGKYEEFIKSIFKENDLPVDLFYLAMIESGLNPKASSYARAVGMWQFIQATGSHYGLRNNWWFDERRDPLLASNAAAEHLKDLYDRFDDWYLALAGYNCNPSKVERRMKQYNTNDFWQLKQLPRQTRNYVPTFIAATILAKNPEKYGFFIIPQKPFKSDTVMIFESLDLELVAQCVDTTFDFIKEINPAVLRWCTPPGVKDFVLHLPEGTKDKFKTSYSNIPEDQKRSWVRHKILQGETISTIANKYATSADILKSYNKIKGNIIRTGDYLIVPVPLNKNYYESFTPTARSTERKKTTITANVPGHKKVEYVVKTGDTLGEIAEKYKTNANRIRTWNGLSYGKHIYPSQKLAIWIPESLPTEEIEKEFLGKNNKDAYYVVKKGDTIWDIAQKYKTSISALLKMNNKRNSRIKPGERLKVRNERQGT